MRQLLEQPRHIFVCIRQRRATCNDDKCVCWQIEILSAQVPVLRFKNCRVNSRRNYSHAAAGLVYWASPGDFGQPMAVCDHACSTIPICPQFPRMRSLRQKSTCRPSQDWTWIARLCLVGVTIAATIEKAASGRVPHVVDADH